MYWILLLVLIIGYQGIVTAHESAGNGLGHYGECGSGKINWPIRSGNMGPITRSKRQSRQSIRIVPYYVTANISTNEILTMLQADDGPVAYVLDYFERTLSVIPFQQSLTAPESATMCGPHVTIPDNHKDPSGPGVANADYLYYITSVNDETCQGGFIIAYAGPCYIVPAMGNRPYIGYTNICPNVFGRYDKDYINTLALHETTHALVFLPTLFDLFPLYDNVISYQLIDGQNITFITTPKVVQAARNHYNCPTLTGGILENEGGELSRGSHWESRTLFPELMNAVLYDTLGSNTRVSRMTLSLFEDSGWYTVNYEAGLTEDEFLWGYGEGCDFVTANCNSTSYPYACEPCCFQNVECAYDYQSAGYCRRAVFFDGCAVVIPARFCTDEVLANFSIDLPQGSVMDYGPQSICVTSDSTSVANCITHECVQIQGTELLAYSLTINGQVEWCYPDALVSNGELQCPPNKYACARSTINMLSPRTDPIPPPLCDPSCSSCTVAQNPGYCLSCPDGRRLNGNTPTTCLLNSNPCNGSTYLQGNGECAACATGCSLCDGPQNSDCLSCDNANLYRDTTNMLGVACVTQCGTGTTGSVDVFGVRTCVVDTNPPGGGGAMGIMRGAYGIAYIVVVMLTFSILY